MDRAPRFGIRVGFGDRRGLTPALVDVADNIFCDQTSGEYVQVVVLVQRRRPRGWSAPQPCHALAAHTLSEMHMPVKYTLWGYMHAHIYKHLYIHIHMHMYMHLHLHIHTSIPRRLYVATPVLPACPCAPGSPGPAQAGRVPDRSALLARGGSLARRCEIARVRPLHLLRVHPSCPHCYE